MNKPVDFPPPDSDAQQHSAQLAARIVDEIRQHGSVTFQRFMQMALYTPGLGYYSAGACKFGEAGDFVTAPLLSPLFSHCVANQCRQVLQQCRHPHILELGAGTGTMALHVLQQLERHQSLPEKYWILETSADLKQRQQTLFRQQGAHLLERVEWLTALPARPFDGVIVANEVLDAMPVHRFLLHDTLQEYFVTWRNHAFQWQLANCDNPKLRQVLQQINIDQLTAGVRPYTSEVNLLLPAWINSLGHCLQQGIVLLIDYGYTRKEYFHPQRHMGTLMCHYRHRAHDNPLIFTGIQDITAHVDFTAVAEAALAADLSIGGFTHQAAFLLNCGLAGFPCDDYETAQQIKRLTLPAEMGERFKVIALTKQFDEVLLGFQQFDQTERL